MSAFDDWWEKSVFATDGRQQLMHPDALRNEKGYLKMAFNAGMERAAAMVAAQSIHSDFPYEGKLMAEKIRKEINTTDKK